MVIPNRTASKLTCDPGSMLTGFCFPTNLKVIGDPDNEFFLKPFQIFLISFSTLVFWMVYSFFRFFRRLYVFCFVIFLSHYCCIVITDVIVYFGTLLTYAIAGFISGKERFPTFDARYFYLFNLWYWSTFT